MSGGVTIAAAIGVMNVATYVATLLCARLLGPREYGGFAAIAGLSLVVGVLMLGLQTTGARRIASAPERVGEIEHEVLRVSYRAAGVMALVCLALTPLVNAALNLESWATAACLALIAWPMTVVGGQAGVLQGERRWQPLALIYLAMGLSRLAGTLLLFWRSTEAVAALGLAFGFAGPCIVGWLALRRSAAYRQAVETEVHEGRSVWREAVSNSQALLAFFVLSNADVVIGRLVLDEHTSGLYAGGLILVKSLLFLPQFVIVVAFPSMATESARRATLIKSVALVLALGCVGTVLVWALSDVALAFIGGQEYADIQDQLWVFAVLGTVLSTVQLLVYSVVARQSRRSVYLVWAAVVALAVAASQTSTVEGMVTVVLAVDLTLMVALLAVSLWRLRGRPPAEPSAGNLAETSSTPWTQ
jgi:O-antigen/teichoic acid export membrane protein